MTRLVTQITMASGRKLTLSQFNWHPDGQIVCRNRTTPVSEVTYGGRRLTVESSVEHSCDIGAEARNGFAAPDLGDDPSRTALLSSSIGGAHESGAGVDFDVHDIDEDGAACPT